MTEYDPIMALVAVDLQKGILGMAPAEVAAPLVETSAKLADAFHAAALPVVWVHATGMPSGRTAVQKPDESNLPHDLTELDPRLPAIESDLHIMKDETFSAFPRTGLADRLRELGVSQVLLCGLATGAGVESTARSAWDEHFNVSVISDACLDPNPERHQNSLEHVIPAIGTVTTSAEVLAALAAR